MATSTRKRIKVRVHAPVPAYKVVVYYGYKDDPPNWPRFWLTTAAAVMVIAALVSMV